MPWPLETLDELRADFARPHECHCTGACLDEAGKQGPCPLAADHPKTLAEFIKQLIASAEAFGNKARVEHLRAVLASADLEVWNAMIKAGSYIGNYVPESGPQR